MQKDVLHLQQRRCGNLSLLLLMPRSVPKNTTGMKIPEKKTKLVLILIKLSKNNVDKTIFQRNEKW